MTHMALAYILFTLGVLGEGVGDGKGDPGYQNAGTGLNGCTPMLGPCCPYINCETDGEYTCLGVDFPEGGGVVTAAICEACD